MMSNNNFVTPPKRKTNNTEPPKKRNKRSVITEQPDEDPNDPIVEESVAAATEDTEMQQQQQVEGDANAVADDVFNTEEPTTTDITIETAQPLEQEGQIITIERTDNDAAATRNLLDSFNEAAAATIVPDQQPEQQAKPVLLNDDDDALFAQGLDQVEKAVEKAEEAEKKLNIFETALELDISCHHNLYFKNPAVEQGIITCKHDTVTYGKHKGKSFNNIKIAFPTQEITQGWLQTTFYNLTSITPPGVIELFSPPPFGNLSELKSSKLERKEKVNIFDPDHPSKCKWSLMYTSKHFGLSTDKDDVEHDTRTRKAYEKLQEAKRIDAYVKAHPELIQAYLEAHPEVEAVTDNSDVADSIPVEAYEYTQESPLTPAQMAELNDNEKFSWQSTEVNSWFYWAEQIEKKMLNAVRSDPNGFGYEYKKAVVTEIDKRYNKECDNLKADSEEWEKKPKATRGPKPRAEKEKFETVFNRNMKTLMKTERSGGTKTLKFSGNTLRTATEAEKAALKNGTLKGANAVLTQICIENGLVEAHFPIYRFLTEAELKDNPETTSPIALMSVAEAVMWIMQHNNKCIGQVVYSPSPMVVSAELMMYYRPIAVLIWNSCDAYRQARTKRDTIVRPAPTKRVCAPAPIKVVESSSAANNNNNNNNFIDTSAFANMAVPLAARYQKKEAAKEGAEGAAAAAVATTVPK